MLTDCSSVESIKLSLTQLFYFCCPLKINFGFNRNTMGDMSAMAPRPLRKMMSPIMLPSSN